LRDKLVQQEDQFLSQKKSHEIEIGELLLCKHLLDCRKLLTIVTHLFMIVHKSSLEELESQLNNLNIENADVKSQIERLQRDNVKDNAVLEEREKELEKGKLGTQCVDWLANRFYANDWDSDRYPTAKIHRKRTSSKA
jgi:hypothetical protein